MATSFQLRVYTPEREVVDAEVNEVTAPAALGEIGVLPDHAALITALAAGVLTYRGPRERGRLTIEGGFAEVRDNVMTVLADGASTLDG